MSNIQANVTRSFDSRYHPQAHGLFDEDLNARLGSLYEALTYRISNTTDPTIRSRLSLALINLLQVMVPLKRTPGNAKAASNFPLKLGARLLHGFDKVHGVAMPNSEVTTPEYITFESMAEYCEIAHVAVLLCCCDSPNGVARAYLPKSGPANGYILANAIKLKNVFAITEARPADCQAFYEAIETEYLTKESGWMCHTNGGCVTRAFADIGVRVPYWDYASTSDLQKFCDDNCVSVSIMRPSLNGCETVMTLRPARGPVMESYGLKVNRDFSHCIGAVRLPLDSKPHFCHSTRCPCRLLCLGAKNIEQIRAGFKKWVAQYNQDHPDAPYKGDTDNLTRRQIANTKAALIEKRPALVKSLIATRAAEPTKGFPKTARAANFTAANFQAATMLPSQMLANMRGDEVPCSTTKDAAERMIAVVEGKAMPPKRFSDHSLMMKITSSGILPLDTLGAGETVIVMSPLLAAYKGALVFRISPTGTDPEVIGYIAPDRDPEEFSNMTAVSAAELSVSAPLVVGGTTVTVAQMTVESGCTDVSPLAVRPGKLATIANGKNADQAIMGAGKHSVIKFTADIDENSVLRHSSTDRQNEQLVKIPNAINQQSVGQLRCSPSRVAVFGAGVPVDASSALAAGYVSTAPGNTAILANAFTTIWRLSNATDYLRHMYFGHMHFVGGLGFQNPAADARTGVRFLVTYSDGSTNQVTQFNSIGSGSLAHCWCDATTSGNTAFEAKSGLFITDIEMQAFCTSNTDVNNPNVQITFEDVAMNTPYLCHVITGAVTAAQLNVQMSVWAECFPDQTTIAGKYLTPDNKLPYTTGHWPDLVRILDHEDCVYEEGQVHKAGFFSMLKKLGKFAWRWGGRSLAHKALEGVDKYMSKGFGSGEKKTRNLGIGFPAVLVDSNDNPTSVKTLLISEGAGDSPALVRSVTSIPLTANGSWEGQSADFAFLLAALKCAGWPVLGTRHNPLIVSGDVENLQYFARGAGPSARAQCEFDLYPVKYTDGKIEADGDVHLLAPEGWKHKKGRGRRSAARSDFFGPGVLCSVKEVESVGGELPVWHFELVLDPASVEM